MLPILPHASRWFVSPDSLSSSRSIGSWPGRYVGSNWNGWNPLITLNRYFLLKQMLRGDPKIDAISTRYCAIASLPHTLRHNMLLTVKMSPRWSGPKGAKTKTSNRFFEQKIINEPEERAKLNFLHLQPPKKKIQKWTNFLLQFSFKWLAVQRDALFVTLKFIVKSISCSAAHTHLGQIRECLHDFHLYRV